MNFDEKQKISRLVLMGGKYEKDSAFTLVWR